MALTLAAARRGACRSADLAAQPGPSRPLPLSGSGRRNTAEIWRSPIYANVGGDRSRRCIPESDVLRGQSRPAWPAAAFAVSREVFASREVKASCCHGECAKSFECYLRFVTAADHSRILDPWIRREVRSSDSAASVLVIGPSVAVRPQAQGRLRRRRRRRVAAIVTRDRRAVLRLRRRGPGYRHARARPSTVQQALPPTAGVPARRRQPLPQARPRRWHSVRLPRGRSGAAMAAQDRRARLGTAASSESRRVTSPARLLRPTRNLTKKNGMYISTKQQVFTIYWIERFLMVYSDSAPVGTYKAVSIFESSSSTDTI